MKLWLDFETRSRCDIREGAYNYAMHPSTDVICLAYAYDNGPIHVWTPANDTPLPNVTNEAKVFAHNAAFDRLIYQYVLVKRYGASPVILSQWHCTSAQARVNGLPASLDNLTRCLGTPHTKHPDGAKLIRALSLPQASGEFNTDPELLARMEAYCVDDVAAMRDASNAMPSIGWTLYGQADYLITEMINDRGIRIDRELADAATSYAEDERAEIGRQLAELTDGAVTRASQTARIKKWVMERVSPSVVTRYMTNAEGKTTLNSATRSALLELDHIPADIKAVVSLCDTANQTSIAKFATMSMLARSDNDRVCGAFVYAGASQTLRHSSRGLQLQNFSRDTYTVETMPEFNVIREAVLAGKRVHNLLPTMKKMLRPALIPGDGNVFVQADWSAVEARGLAWLAGDRDRLRIFDQNEDIYLHTCALLSLPPTQRQIGKVAELALGYGGGVGAFASMASMFGVEMPEHEVKAIVKDWRAANPMIVQFWFNLFDAAVSAILQPNKVCHAGKVSYLYDPAALNGLGLLTATVELAVTISYPAPEYRDGELSALKGSVKPKVGEPWPRVTLWHGLLAENIVQAVCGALLRDSAFVLETVAVGISIVMLVHDEIVAEVPITDAEAVRDTIKAVMEEPPEWAEGFPLDVTTAIMPRYGKA